MSGERKRRKGLYGWLDERYDVSALIEIGRRKQVPVGVHSMFWYYLGGATLFFFIVQVISGALLLMYYQPGEDTSYESIRFLTTKVPFGWLMRSVHAWSAHLMIVSLLAHMFSTMMLKAYRPPRELTWVTGFLLLAVALGFGFSGYLLPWNELAYFATKVGTASVEAVPLVGDWMLQVLRGGHEVSIKTLYRFMALHVVVLPLIISIIVGLHLLFIQRQGMAPPITYERPPRGLRFLPNFILRDALLWLICLIAIVTLAVFFPYGAGIPGVEWELGQKADPLAPAPPGIKPEWYFLWVYQLLKEFPPHVLGVEGPKAAVLLVMVMMGVWALVPWLDRRARRNEPSPAFTDFGVAALFFVIFLTIKAWDIGAGEAAVLDEAAERRVAWFSAWITLGLLAGVTALRAVFYGQRQFLFSGAVALHVVLHGLFGVRYLPAGVIAAALAAVAAVAWRVVRRRRARAEPEGET